MGWLGVMLLMGGGLWGALVWCVEGRRRHRVGRELRRQLLILERGIFVQRRPLEELAKELESQSEETAAFWGEIRLGMAGEEIVDVFWRRAAGRMPPPYHELLSPLGAALSLGEKEAAIMLSQIGEDIVRHLRQEEQTSRERERLAVVLGVSLSAMAALALI